MEFYFSHRNIPELNGLTKAQRTEVWAATMGRRFRDPFLLLALLILLVVVGVCFFLGSVLIPWSYGGVVGGAVGSILGNFVVSGLLVPRARPHLSDEIQARGWQNRNQV